MNELEIVRDLLLQHKGKGNPITSGEIARVLGFPRDDTQVKARGLIEEVMRVYELPVAACSRGYYIAISDDEFNNYLADLDGRIVGIGARKSRFISNYQNNGRN